MLYHKTTLENVIFDWIEDNPLDQSNVSHTQLYRWGVETLKDVLTVDSSKQKIKIIQLKNTKGELPKDFHKIIAVAYRKYPKKGGRCTTVDKVVQYTQAQYGDQCDIEINLKCDNCKKDNCSCNDATIEVDVNKIWEMENPWYYNPTKFGMPFDSNDFNNPDIDGKFKRIAPATGDFFNLKYHIGECVNLKFTDCEHKYRITTPALIETDIIDRENNTELLISYLGKETDENGDLLVPDITDVIEAVQYQLSYRFYRRMALQTGNNIYKQESSEALFLRDQAIGRANLKLSLPEVDELRAELSESLYRPRNTGPVKTWFNSEDYMKY